jgi:hypothetical protein
MVKQDIDGTNLISFYATSKEPIEGVDYYCQLSVAVNDNYFIGTIMRDREDYNNEDSWVRHSFNVHNTGEAFTVADAFVKSCKQLGIFDDNDLSHYSTLWN